MNAENSYVLITAGVLSALVGAAMVAASTQRIEHRLKRAISRLRGLWGGLAGALSRTSAVTGVILGTQWAVVGPTGPAAVPAAVVLGVPAFLAGATVTRLLAVLRIIHGRRRRARAACRGLEARR